MWGMKPGSYAKPHAAAAVATGYATEEGVSWAVMKKSGADGLRYYTIRVSDIEQAEAEGFVIVFNRIEGV